MNVLMYPFGPDDDFPDEFCAIRQGSGEHWFYTPVGEDTSWMLFRALDENAKLRELAGFVLQFETMTDGCGDTCPYACRNCEDECYFRKVAGEIGVEC